MNQIIVPQDNPFYGLGQKMTDEQIAYRDSILRNPVTVVDAGPGTGKTTIAVATAKFLYENRAIKNLVYLFHPAEEDEMGYRPGDQTAKDLEYLGPLQQALVKVNEMPQKINSGAYWVIGKSHTFIRGTNIEDSVIIIDEAQNFPFHKLKKAITRIHDSCKLILIGHQGQCDLPDPAMSGFAPYIEHFRQVPNKAGIITLSHDFRGWLSTYADSLQYTPTVSSPRKRRG